jgi:hypothetical protein
MIFIIFLALLILINLALIIRDRCQVLLHLRPVLFQIPKADEREADHEHDGGNAYHNKNDGAFGGIGLHC